MKRLVFASLIALASTQAHATDISEGDDCRAVAVFEPTHEGGSETILMFAQDQAGFDEDDIKVGFNNQDWSIASGDELGTIRVTADDGSWLESNAFAGEHGFILATKWEWFRDVFSHSGGIEVTRKGGARITGLSSSFSEYLEFMTCRNKKVVVKAERDRKEGLARSIPVDPFAKKE